MSKKVIKKVVQKTQASPFDRIRANMDKSTGTYTPLNQINQPKMVRVSKRKAT